MIIAKYIRTKNATRFRIDKKKHMSNVRKNGSYLFSCPGRASVRKSAKAVDNILKRKKRGWYSDRGYLHTYIYKKEIFK